MINADALRYAVRTVNAKHNSQWDFRYMIRYACIDRKFGSVPALEDALYHSEMFGSVLEDVLGPA